MVTGTRLKVCIYGAGAIGGFIGTRLAATDRFNVSAIARGATLDALNRHGWRLRQDGTLLQAPLARAVREPRELGVQDLVVIAVKGQSLPSIAASIGALIGPETVVLPAMNGVPWWFGEGTDALSDQPIESVDPGGRIAAAIPYARVLGCVVHASVSTPEPGLVAHRIGRGLIVGDPSGGRSDRVDDLVSLLSDAGFDATTSTRIRQDIWYKLWGNLTTNPVSAITGATTDRILDDPEVRLFCERAMDEANAIGARIGCAIHQTPDDRNAITRKLGAFKTSMLQDVEAGRSIELDAIVRSVCELGRRVGVATPNVDALLGLTRLFGRVHGLYPLEDANDG